MMTTSRFLPLTGPQYQIWLAEMNCPDHALFTESALLHFSSDVSIDFLNRNLNLLVQDTEVLRIRLTLQDGAPVQYDAGYFPFACRCFPLARAEDLSDAFDRDSRQSFTLYNSPLFRCLIYSLPDKKAVLLQSHHLITDGYGFAKICDRFLSLCAGKDPQPLIPFLPLCEKQKPLTAQGETQMCIRDRLTTFAKSIYLILLLLRILSIKQNWNPLTMSIRSSQNYFIPFLRNLLPLNLRKRPISKIFWLMFRIVPR